MTSLTPDLLISCKALLSCRVVETDLLDLAQLDFLHRGPRRLDLRIHLGRAALEQLPGPRPRNDDVLQLVHTGSFPANELVIAAITPVIAGRRARCARTIAR